MMFSNKVKAVGLFVVVLYALYGGELVNVSRDPRRMDGGGWGGGATSYVGVLDKPRAPFGTLPGHDTQGFLRSYGD